MLGAFCFYSGTVGQKNPLRYRGYYFDYETLFYCLDSRYYDPFVGRFVNADGYMSTGQGVLGYNMFAYCLNSPIILEDSTGSRPVIDDLRGETAEQRELSFSYIRANVKYTEPFTISPVGTYNNGKGNVYIVNESQVDLVDRSDTNTVVIIDSRNSSDPNYNSNMRILDSYKIRKGTHKKEIAQIMLNYNAAHPSSPAWTRTLDSLKTEWDAHNMIYYCAFGDDSVKSRVKDCDFDNDDEGKNCFGLGLDYVKEKRG